MDTRPKLRQFFSYFGGKLRNGKRYPEPVYDTIVEPFAGGAGYSHHYYDRNVNLYDTNKAVVNAWSFLIQASRRDVLSLPLLSVGDKLSDFSLSDPERCFIGFWLVRASATPRNTLTQWAVKYPNRLWGEHIRTVIANQVHLISHWKVSELSYTQIDNVECTWFIDPPYIDAGKFYPDHDIDYPQLALWCKQRSGQAIVCEAGGADWLPFQDLYQHKGIQRASRREVVWFNT